MNRYDHVASISPGTTFSLIQAASLFKQFIEECMAEGMDPQACPAILFLGQHLAFHCHTDVGAENMPSRLYARCIEESENRRHRLKEVH